MIPEGWALYKLSDLIDLIGGGTPKTGVPQYWDGEIPWLSVVDFGNSTKHVYKTEKKITEKGLLESSTKLLKKGHLIISARGTVGELAVLGENMAFNQSCYGINSKEKTINDYIYYLIKHNVSQIRRKTHGAVFDTITRQTFENIEAQIPTDLFEQSRIASILSSLDDKIELNLQMNQTLEAIAQAIFKEWFVDFNFPGADGKLVDGLPMGWERTTIESIIEELEVGSRPKGGVKEIMSGIPSIGAESITRIGEFDYDKTKYISEDFYKKMRKGHIKQLDILIYKDGGKPGNYVPHISMFGYEFPFDKLCINEHVYRIKCKTNSLQMYLFFWLNTVNCIKEMTEKGTGVAIPGLNSTALKSINIVIPNESCLSAFELISSSIIKKILTNSKNNSILSKVRDLLLPKLMTGKIRVA